MYLHVLPSRIDAPPEVLTGISLILCGYPNVLRLYLNQASANFDEKPPGAMRGENRVAGRQAPGPWRRRRHRILWDRANEEEAQGPQHPEYTALGYHRWGDDGSRAVTRQRNVCGIGGSIETSRGERQGALVGEITIARDVTAMFQAEEALRRADRVRLQARDSLPRLVSH